MIGRFDFKCWTCGKKFELLIVGNAESKNPCCSHCGGRYVEKLFSPPKSGHQKGILPGGYADPFSNSDLAVRPDKDHPGREMLWTYKRIEELSKKGQTRPIDEREMKMIKDRMACYEKQYGPAR